MNKKKLISTEVTRYTLEIKINDNSIIVFLSKDFIAWNLEVKDVVKLTLSEIIDICNLIYSENVISPTASIEIKGNKKEEDIYIRGQEDVTAAVIRAVKIMMPKKG